jgi:hypothetical protein
MIYIAAQYHGTAAVFNTAKFQIESQYKIQQVKSGIDRQ